MKAKTGRGLFTGSDQDQSDQEDFVRQLDTKVTKSPQVELFEEHLAKYISNVKEFSIRAQKYEQSLFQDGISYVNHPLIEITKINYEKNIGIFDIIDLKGNRSTFMRTMVVFTYLNNQIEKILEMLETKYYNILLMYGQQPQNKQTESPQVMTARVIHHYKNIYDLVRKLMSFIQNIILQLHSILNKKNPLQKLVKPFHFDFALDTIGRALRGIYIIDCIVQNNSTISQHWQIYRKMIKLVKNQPEKFETNVSTIKKLDKLTSKFENTILTQKCMELVIDIKFDEIYQKSKPEFGLIKNNRDFKEFFEAYCNKQFQQINSNLGAKYQSDQHKKLLSLLCNYSLFRKLFPSQQMRDFYKKAWLMQKKLPLIQAHSFVCVYLSNFLQTVCPLIKKSKNLDPRDENLALKAYIQKIDENISIDLVSKYTKFCVWLSRMESVATSNYSLTDIKNDEKTKNMLQERLKNRIQMLLQGVHLIMKTNQLLYLCFMLHFHSERTIKDSLLGYLIICLESIKGISYILKKKTDAFDTTILSKQIAKDILHLLSPLLKKAQQQQKNKNKPENAQKFAALSTLTKLLWMPMSELKITMIKYCIYYLGENGLGEEIFFDLQKLQRKLQIVCYHQILVQKYENCSYLYVYMEKILKNIFDWKQSNPHTCKRLQFLFDAFEDNASMLLDAPHLSENNLLFNQYKAFILKQFEKNYMVPLKKKVQDHLRMSTHFMLIEKLEGINPYATQLSDLTKLLQLEKLRIFDTMIDLRIQISKSFNQTFYNMTILNTYDMETYQQMRILGSHLFGLTLHDVFLPSQTIQQGKFDILRIIRNIPKFIDNHKYNLLSQQFLEVTHEGKIIQCISIQQLSDSIKTHGLGILATTVNAFYKILINKVQSFNKFLFDDYIQTPLAKEKKWFLDYVSRQDYPGYYPYERAEHLYKQIKKIGRFQDETNFLDKFRETITAVGNSLGFVRLLRSASLNSSSKGIEFLPKKLEINETFRQFSEKSTFSQTTISACAQLDKILQSFDEKFSSKIDYLNLMIKMFAKIVTKENKHLKFFYLIVPALSINYVEHVSKGKQQVTKKVSSNGFIYDDGFILGLSYFLNLLKQTDDYKTIHWDDAVEIYMNNARNYSKEVSTGKHSAKFVEDLALQRQLALKKIETMQQQFNYFNYNLVSANVLFKSKTSQKNPVSPPSNQNEQQSNVQ